MEGLDVEDGAIDQLHNLPEVPVRAFIRLFEEYWFVLTHDCMRLGEFIFLKVCIPLQHDPVGPHIYRWRVELPFEDLC